MTRAEEGMAEVAEEGMVEVAEEGMVEVVEEGIMEVEEVGIMVEEEEEVVEAVEMGMDRVEEDTGKVEEEIMVVVMVTCLPLTMQNNMGVQATITLCSTVQCRSLTRTTRTRKASHLMGLRQHISNTMEMEEEGEEEELAMDLAWLRQ
jgi:hypothetical protein